MAACCHYCTDTYPRIDALTTRQKKVQHVYRTKHRASSLTAAQASSVQKRTHPPGVHSESMPGSVAGWLDASHELSHTSLHQHRQKHNQHAVRPQETTAKTQMKQEPISETRAYL